MKELFLTLLVINLSFHGYLKGFLYNRLHNASIERGGVRFQGRVVENFTRGKLLGEFNINEDLTKSSPEIYPVEAYLDLYLPFMDLRFGKQFIFWGYSHWIIPTDTTTPWNFEKMGPELEDYRIPVFALRTWFYIKSYELELIFLPYPEFNKTTVPENWVEEELPYNLKYSEFGAKFSGKFSSVEYFLSFHYGFDRYPSFYPTSTTSGLILHKRMRTVGFGMRSAIGKFVLRGEGAFSLTDDPQNTDPFVRNPFFHVVFSPSFYPSQDSEITLLGSRIQYINEDETSKSYTTLLLRFSHKFSDLLKLEGDFVYEVERKAYLLLGFFKISPFDEGALFIGSVLFGGEKGPFSKLEKKDTFFTEFKYWF